jgi:hypothetical protein
MSRHVIMMLYVHTAITLSMWVKVESCGPGVAAIRGLDAGACKVCSHCIMLSASVTLTCTVLRYCSSSLIVKITFQ